MVRIAGKNANIAEKVSRLSEKQLLKKGAKAGITLCEAAKKKMEQLIREIRNILEEDVDIKRLFVFFAKSQNTGLQVEFAGVGKVSVEEVEKWLGKDVWWSIGKGGSGSEIYTSVEYEGTVKVNGEVRDVSRKVYQRNDIDFEYFDETTGLTNLERMQAGKPPIGTDGNAIQLHHILQKEAGPMVEIREITHQEYYSQLHGLIEDGASFRNDPILNKQYNNFRRSYWKWRAEQIVGGK